MMAGKDPHNPQMTRAETPAEGQRIKRSLLLREKRPRNVAKTISDGVA
jgi:hypothetical protein